jgi:hypothetical protein
VRRDLLRVHRSIPLGELRRVRRDCDPFPIANVRRKAGGEAAGERGRHAFSLAPRARDIPDEIAGIR